MINAMIVSDNLNFVEKVVNEISIKSLDINVSNISTSFESAIYCAVKNNPDIIFSDTKIDKQYNSLLSKAYPNNLVVMDENEIFKIDILEHIHTLTEIKNADKNRLRIIHELKNLGYNLKYSGTYYLIDTILTISLNKNKKTANLQSGIFPIIAKKYNRTTFNVKASINRATDCMYAECNIERLKEYFHFSVDTKPTVKQVVFAVLENI